MLLDCCRAASLTRLNMYDRDPPYRLVRVVVILFQTGLLVHGLSWAGVPLDLGAHPCHTNAVKLTECTSPYNPAGTMHKEWGCWDERGWRRGAGSSWKGRQHPEEWADAVGRAMGSVKPRVLKDSPDVFSIGYRCQEEGWSFHWPAWSCSPYWRRPDGKYVILEVDQY